MIKQIKNHYLQDRVLTVKLYISSLTKDIIQKILT